MKPCYHLCLFAFLLNFSVPVSAKDFHGFDPANYNGAMLSAAQLQAMVADAVTQTPPQKTTVTIWESYQSDQLSLPGYTPNEPLHIKRYNHATQQIEDLNQTLHIAPNTLWTQMTQP